MKKEEKSTKRERTHKTRETQADSEAGMLYEDDRVDGLNTKLYWGRQLKLLYNKIKTVGIQGKKSFLTVF